MDISKAIIDLRERKKVKQSEIANKLGIDQPNYSRLEKRGDKLTIEQLQKIAEALEVSLAELLGFMPQTNEQERIKELEGKLEYLQVYSDTLVSLSKFQEAQYNRVKAYFMGVFEEELNFNALINNRGGKVRYFDKVTNKTLVILDNDEDREFEIFVNIKEKGEEAYSHPSVIEEYHNVLIIKYERFKDIDFRKIEKEFVLNESDRESALFNLFSDLEKDEREGEMYLIYHLIKSGIIDDKSIISAYEQYKGFPEWLIAPKSIT